MIMYKFKIFKKIVKIKLLKIMIILLEKKIRIFKMRKIITKMIKKMQMQIKIKNPKKRKIKRKKAYLLILIRQINNMKKMKYKTIVDYKIKLL
jgi:hypothetical protein